MIKELPKYILQLTIYLICAYALSTVFLDLNLSSYILDLSAAENYVALDARLRPYSSRRNSRGTPVCYVSETNLSLDIVTWKCNIIQISSPEELGG